jgi:hypothetical protein
MGALPGGLKNAPIVPGTAVTPSNLQSGIPNKPSGMGQFGDPSVNTSGLTSAFKGTNAGLNQYPLPAMPNITSPVTSDQIGGAQTGVINSLTSTNNLLTALGGGAAAGTPAGNLQQAYAQGQTALGQNNALNGVGLQGAATDAQTSLTGQLGNAGGVGAQTGAIQSLQGISGQQQTLANQLQGVASGQGPNPAQAMLNQQTGANVANQAALMASQRGAGANVGLMARQAAQQGAGTQQQAVGQGATMQAQQSLGAMGQLQGQQQAMAGTQGEIGALGQGLTTQQQASINAGFGQGANIVGQGQSQQVINAGVAQNQVGNQLGGAGLLQSGQLANAGQLLGAAGQYNADITAGQGNVNAGNTNLNTGSNQGRRDITGGLMNAAGPILSNYLGGVGGAGAGAGAGAAAGAGGEATAGADAAETIGEIGAMAARGGEVTRHYADGGNVYQPNSGPSNVPIPSPIQTPIQGPQSDLGKFLSGNIGSLNQEQKSKLQTGTESVAGNIFGTGTAMASRGGLASQGGHVDAKSPDQKATKSGNSYANDKVPAMLSEGEIVLPRSVTQSADPQRSAADFVAKVLAKRRAK